MREAGIIGNIMQMIVLIDGKPTYRKAMHMMIVVIQHVEVRNEDKGSITARVERAGSTSPSSTEF